MFVSEIIKVWQCLLKPLDDKFKAAISCDVCLYVDYCDDLMKLTGKYTPETSEGLRALLRKTG